MKLTPGLNLINVLRAAFALADPESGKKTYNLTVFFAKAACRTLMQLTPNLQFTFLFFFYFFFKSNHI